MRFDNVKGRNVCTFICGMSACDKTCCMQQVLGRCYSIADAWDKGSTRDRMDLLRVIKYRIKHGERTLKEAKKIGIVFKAEVV